MLFSSRPIELPNKIAIPWLKKEPKATPSKILIVFTLQENDNTNNWVLSPNSEIKTNKKAIIKGYINCIINNSFSIIYVLKIIILLFVKSLWKVLHTKKYNDNILKKIYGYAQKQI